MKSYTDLEQSKKLAEILPLESADYCWGIDDETLHYNNSPYPCAWKDYTCKEYYIPCWSLVALLQIMPKYIEGLNRLRIDIDDVDFSIWYDDMKGYGVNDKLPDITLKEPINACYEMIIKLNELKIL